MVYCNREQRGARSWTGEVIHRKKILLVLCYECFVGLDDYLCAVRTDTDNKKDYKPVVCYTASNIMHAGQ